jgi:hypothetical protein
MATQPTTAPSATSALVPIAAGIEYNLDAFPENRFNRLFPVQDIRMASDLMVPSFRVVKLSSNPDDGDIYHTTDMKDGYFAPSARALAALSDAASVSFPEERRTDDGSNPELCRVTVRAEMVTTSGMFRPVSGSAECDLNRMPWTSPAQRAKFKSKIFEHTVTRARNRAIRGLLSLRGSYPKATYDRPFLVVAIQPNLNQAEIRQAYIASVVPTIAQLYGPSRPAPQLAAGQVIEGPERPEAPEEDDGVIDGQATDAGPEPSWFGTEAPTAVPANDRAARLAAILREKAASSGMVGPATAPQLQKLAEVFVAKGITRPETDAGLRIVFGVTGRADFLGSQAQALIEASIDAEFGDLWRELVAGAQAA